MNGIGAHRHIKQLKPSPNDNPGSTDNDTLWIAHLCRHEWLAHIFLKQVACVANRVLLKGAHGNGPAMLFGQVHTQGVQPFALARVRHTW